MINSISPKINTGYTPIKRVNSSPVFTGRMQLANKVSDEFVSSVSHKKSSFFKRISDFIKGRTAKTSLKTEPWAQNLQEKILSVTKTKSEAKGKDAIVYDFPGRDDFVLRVEKNALKNIDKLPKDLKLIPISYDKSVAENPNFGLPLYFIAPKTSSLAKNKSLAPTEALSQPDKIMILRKMSGERPSAKYFESFAEMFGYGETPDPNQTMTHRTFRYVGKKYGYEAAKKYLQKCKEGATEVKAGELGKDSEELEILGGQKFYKNYRTFVNDYIESIKNISDMPQKAYDKAVKNITSKKDFILDFQHTNNTYVDVKNGEFNFMDFVFDKSTYPKYHYENPVKEFRNVLLGKCFSAVARTPREYIIMPDDIKAVKHYSKIINEKVNTAAPERFRSESPFK